MISAEAQGKPVPVEHVDGLSHIEIMGQGRGRFCLYENRRLSCGKVIMLPKRDIIMPLSSLPDAINKAIAVSAQGLTGMVYRYLPFSMH